MILLNHQSCRFSNSELTEIVADVAQDPTLPRTEDHLCPKWVCEPLECHNNLHLPSSNYSHFLCCCRRQVPAQWSCLLPVSEQKIWGMYAMHIIHHNDTLYGGWCSQGLLLASTMLSHPPLSVIVYTCLYFLWLLWTLHFGWGRWPFCHVTCAGWDETLLRVHGRRLWSSLDRVVIYHTTLPVTYHKLHVTTLLCDKWPVQHFTYKSLKMYLSMIKSG